MLGRIVCLFAGHRINRRRVKHDGLAFHTHCWRCKAPMTREPQGWIVDRPISGHKAGH